MFWEKKEEKIGQNLEKISLFYHFTEFIFIITIYFTPVDYMGVGN